MDLFGPNPRTFAFPIRNATARGSHRTGMNESKDYLIGFLGFMLIAAVYAGSYAISRTQYPDQRLEMCDVSEWDVQIPDSALTRLFRPAIAIEQQMICCDIVIKVVDNR